MLVEETRRRRTSPWLRFAAAVSVLGALISGCSQGSTVAQTPSPSVSSPAATRPLVASLIDPRWMGFDTSHLSQWEEINRLITPELQRFGFRPLDENRGPRYCQGCGEKSPTAEVTIYAPGKYDPTDARTGQPIDVDGHGGFFRAERWDAFPAVESPRALDAVLAWQYAENAWATVQGMTILTSGLERLLELARALRPDERTPAVAPLSLANVPADMPLASIYRSNLRILGHSSDYGTELGFGPCASSDEGDCRTDENKDVGMLSVLIWHRDDFTDGRYRVEVPYQIGGQDGRYDRSVFWAAALPADGLYVQFDLIPPRDPEPTAEQRDVLSSELEGALNSVAWVQDPGNEAAWPPITDWVK